MEDRKWAPPSRPLLLELLALVFVILAIAIPTYLQRESAASQTPPESAVSQTQGTRGAQVLNEEEWAESSHSLFWGVGILGLYLVHLYIANASNDRISTSVTHFLSPIVFAMITYYRLYKLKGASIEVVSGSPFEIAKWVIGVFAITILLARLRMVGHKKHFADVQWDMISKAPYDSTYFGMIIYAYPLLYPPRRYYVCSRGLLIEGWLYIMPIPFDVIHSVEAMKSVSMMNTGTFLASSAKSLMRIQLNDQKDPVFISPENRTDFVKYCMQHLKPLAPDVRTRMV